jgi:hypothetical protein
MLRSGVRGSPYDFQSDESPWVSVRVLGIVYRMPTIRKPKYTPVEYPIHASTFLSVHRTVRLRSHFEIHDARVGKSCSSSRSITDERLRDTIRDIRGSRDSALARDTIVGAREVAKRGSLHFA